MIDLYVINFFFYGKEIVMNGNNCEIVKFKNDGLELDVNVSANEETVWLTV